MSDMSKAARAANRKKAQRLSAGDPKQKVDASSWTPPKPLNTTAKTGMSPVSRRAFKRGGKVAGGDCTPNMGRKARKSGGGVGKQIADAYSTRNVKEANEEKFGKPHVGGFKRGGRTGKMDGGMMDPRAAAAASIANAAGRSGVPAGRMGFVRKAAVPLPGSSGMKKGGAASDKEQDKKLIKKAFRQHENAEHGGKHSELKLKKGGKADPYGGDRTPPPGMPPTDQVPVDQANPPGSKRGGRAQRADGGRMPSALDLAQQREDARLGMTPPEDLYGGARMAKMRAMRNEARNKALDMADAARQRETDKMVASAPARAKAYIAKKEAESRADKPGLFSRMKSAVGLKKGGAAKGNYDGGTRPTGGRIARKKGGRTNIVIAISPQAPQQPMPGGSGPIRPPGMPVVTPPPGSMGAAPGAAAAPPAMPVPMPMPAPAAPAGAPPMARKDGGKVGHRSYRSYKDMDAGSGSGFGRLEKTEIAEHQRPGRKTGGKVGHRSYSSYKDMDAGSGTGFGRLEKTEIAKKKR